MKATLKRVDAREFARLAAMTGLQPAACEMARLVLVEGKTLTEAAAQCGTYKQRVSLAVESIRRVHQGAVTRSGWVRMEVEMPERLSKGLVELLEAMKVAKSRDEKALALVQVEHAIARALQTLKLDQGDGGGAE